MSTAFDELIDKYRPMAALLAERTPEQVARDERVLYGDDPPDPEAKKRAQKSLGYI